jgi:hypothetical protein
VARKPFPPGKPPDDVVTSDAGLSTKDRVRRMVVERLNAR